MAAFMVLIYLVIYFAVCGAFFQLAKKAGRDDIAWFAFIPILNSILQLKLIKQSAWWVLILLVPIANVVFAIIWQVKLLNAFGKNGGLRAVRHFPGAGILDPVDGLGLLQQHRLLSE